MKSLLLRYSSCDIVERGGTGAVSAPGLASHGGAGTEATTGSDERHVIKANNTDEMVDKPGYYADEKGKSDKDLAFVTLTPEDDHILHSEQFATASEALKKFQSLYAKQSDVNRMRLYGKFLSMLL